MYENAHEIADDLLRFSGRHGPERKLDRGEQVALHDDQRPLRITVARALAEEEPTWWMRIGETEWMLLGFAETAAVARSPERGVVEVKFLGSLAGGSLVERWHNGDEVTLTFEHERLPAPVVVTTGGGNGLERHKHARAAFRQWANSPRP